MRKFIAVLELFIFCLLLSFRSSPAFAESNRAYSRALTHTTGFYSDYNGAYLKFYIPYGYYVRVLEVNGDYAKVSYMPENSTFPVLTGYVKTVDLIISDTVPASPYPLLYITVDTDDVLFSDSSLSVSKAGIYSGSLALYYGEISSPSGEELVYVYVNGYLGYMRKNSFSLFTVPENPEPLPSSSSYSAPTSVKNDKSASSLQILLVALISVAVAIIVYVLFRPTDKRDYED